MGGIKTQVPVDALAVKFLIYRENEVERFHQRREGETVSFIPASLSAGETRKSYSPVDRRVSFPVTN